MDRGLSRDDVEMLANFALASENIGEISEQLHKAVQIIDQRFESHPDTRGLGSPLHDGIARLEGSLTSLASVMMRFSVLYEDTLTVGVSPQTPTRWNPGKAGS